MGSSCGERRDRRNSNDVAAPPLQSVSRRGRVRVSAHLCRQRTGDGRAHGRTAWSRSSIQPSAAQSITPLFGDEPKGSASESPHRVTARRPRRGDELGNACNPRPEQQVCRPRFELILGERFGEHANAVAARRRKSRRCAVRAVRETTTAVACRYAQTAAILDALSRVSPLQAARRSRPRGDR